MNEHERNTDKECAAKYEGFEPQNERVLLVIDIQHVTKIYHTPGGDVRALDDVSLQINQGEIFGIIGLSGAGKSTLIRCINRLEQPTSGSILLEGKEITALNKNELRLQRQKISMIFQHFNLLSSRNVVENIMFPLEIAKVPKSKAKERAIELLDLVGLSDKAQAYPSQLSGGQKQRVGIARALANEPRLLLSDEATSALDPQTTRSILDLLKYINRELGLTILLITHDMNVVKQVCDRVAVMENGRIVETNSVLQLFTNPSTPISKSFIHSVIHHEVPQELLQVIEKNTSEKSRQTCFVRLSFIGSAAGQPFISVLVKKFEVMANILYGNIDRVKDIPYGNLTLEFVGTSDSLKEAIAWLQSLEGLELEVLENV